MCLILIIFALIIPIDQQINIGGLSFELKSSLNILGRVFILSNDDRGLIILFYILGLVWFVGSEVIQVEKKFIPLGLTIVSLFVAAIAVQPFLYAAIIIELAVLISMLMMVSKKAEIGSGILRYLIIQSFSMPFILLAGWAAGGVEANPTDERLLIQAVVLLSLGFAFLLAAFPFYTWLPQLTHEASPYIAGFLLSLLPTVGLFLLLKFINAFTWLREFSTIFMAFRFIGGLMIITAGLWVIFQQDLTRIFGYAVILENGYSLLALGYGNEQGYKVFTFMLISRFISIALMALSLSILKKSGRTEIKTVKGLMYEYPVASVVFLTSLLSFGGFPLSAGFPARIVFFTNVPKENILLFLWVLIGSLGFIVVAIRCFNYFIKKEDRTTIISESWQENILLIGGMLINIFVGLFPMLIFNKIINILNSFANIF